MSRALDKHRIAVKYGDGLDTLIFGDDAAKPADTRSDDAKLYSGFISDIATSAGQTAAKKYEKKPAAGTPGAPGAGAGGGQPQQRQGGSSGMPTWGYFAIAGGVGVFGLLAYKAFK